CRARSGPSSPSPRPGALPAWTRSPPCAGSRCRGALSCAASMHEGSRRAIVAAFLANLGIAVTKLLAFLATGAASMLAEAVHSLADTGKHGLLLLGARLAGREATSEHPFGYGRERYFWAFVVALVLFSLGAVFAVTEGIAKLRNPHQLSDPFWAIGVLLVAIALEAWSLRTAVREANQVRGRQSFARFVHTTKSPELPV